MAQRKLKQNVEQLFTISRRDLESAVEGLQVIHADIAQRIERLKGVMQISGTKPKDVVAVVKGNWCDKCARGYKTKALLTRHNRTAHGVYVNGPYKRRA